MATNDRILIVLINWMYFVVGLLMSIMSAIIPNMIDSYHLSYQLAAVLPFAFYIAFAFFCIPAGMANERYKDRYVLTAALATALAGSLLFAIFPVYGVSVASLFLIGGAMAVLQVCAVPLLYRVCGADKLAFHSTLNQLMYGIGAFLSPHIYSFAIRFFAPGARNNRSAGIFQHTIDAGLQWTLVYWLFAVLLAVTVAVFFLVKFPRQETRIDLKTTARVYAGFFRNRKVLLFLATLTAYASCEQGAGVWMTRFLQETFGVAPETQGASLLSLYWILLSLGCLAGMLLLRYVDSRYVLFVFTICALVCLTLALHGNTKVALWAYPAIGLFESVMWPIVLALAFGSVKENHGALSGFLLMGSVGGAAGPMIIGAVSDHLGLKAALHYLYIPLTIVLTVCFWTQYISKPKPAAAITSS